MSNKGKENAAVLVSAAPIRFGDIKAEIQIDLWMFSGKYARVEVWYFRRTDPASYELTSCWQKVSKKLELYRAGQLAQALVRRYGKLAHYQITNLEGKKFIHVPAEVK